MQGREDDRRYIRPTYYIHVMYLLAVRHRDLVIKSSVPRINPIEFASGDSTQLWPRDFAPQATGRNRDISNFSSQTTTNSTTSTSKRSTIYHTPHFDSLYKGSNPPKDRSALDP